MEGVLRLKKPNWQIVYRAMEFGKEIELIDMYKYTVVDGKLCVILKYWNDTSSVFNDPPDEIRYSESTMPLNMFVEYCEAFSEEDMIGFVYYNAMKGKKNDR